MIPSMIQRTRFIPKVLVPKLTRIVANLKWTSLGFVLFMNRNESAPIKVIQSVSSIDIDKLSGGNVRVSNRRYSISFGVVRVRNADCHLIGDNETFC